MADDTQAQEPYALSDIAHAFKTMELYVTYDEDKTITFDTDAAGQDPDVSELDIAIALDFAVHSNDILDAAGTGPVGQVNEMTEDRGEELAKALEELRDGKFSELFGSGDGTGPVGNVNDATITPTSWTGTPDIHPTSHGDSSGPAPVCGGGFTHPQINDGDVDGFPSKSHAVLYLLTNGYHSVAPYATLHFTNDYAKVVNVYGCNNGPFRDQGVIWADGSEYLIRMHASEPNPEVLAYWWPAYWWGAYVYDWHGP